MQNSEFSKILGQGVKKRFSLGAFLKSKTFLFALVLIELVVIIYLVNPSTLLLQIQNNQIVAEVSSKAKVNSQETPVIAVISDANTLRSQNSIQKEIYKNAQNGDYIVGYSDKMLIYRRQEGAIIYEGDTPQAKLEKTRIEIVENVTNAVKNEGIIDFDSQETPQYTIIADASKLREENSIFYKDAKNGDVLAFFSEAGVVVIYRQESMSIVNSGRYSTVIK